MVTFQRNSLRPRVIGSSLTFYVGDRVSLFGMINEISSDKKSLQITTTDQVTVNVCLNEEFKYPIEGAVDIYGVVKSKTTIEASDCVYWKPEALEDFDADDYNEFLQMNGGVIGNKYILLPKRNKKNNQRFRKMQSY